MLRQPLTMGSTSLNAEHPPRLKNLCRMCASSCVNPVQIFGSEGIENELAVKFSTYLPLLMTESDTLPLQLCYECTNMLIQWDAAVLVAIAADKKLRALQWREQQSQNLNREKTEEFSNQPINQHEPAKRQFASGESLCCSVCKKSGMDFRELVEHLKGHDMPGVDAEESNTGSLFQDNFSSNSELEIDEELLQPIVCIETPKKGRKSSPMKRNSDGKQKGSSSPTVMNNSRRQRRKTTKDPVQQPPLTDAEGDSGDPVVTSSTNGISIVADGHNSMTEEQTKSVENSKKDSSHQLTCSPPRPKVRIISAESINQTLEERAKANQQARKEELEKSQLVVGHLQQPVRNVDTAPASKWTKVVIPGSLVKAISGSDNSPTKPRFLKLSDGRIIRLLGNINKPDNASKTVYASGSLIRKIPQSVGSRLGVSGAAQEKLPVSASSSKSPSAPTVSSPVSPGKESAGGDSLDSGDTAAPLRRSVMLGSSRIITFSLQPGPKHSLTRYMCMFCGRRNLQQDLLHEHAQTHTPKKDGSNSNSTPPVPLESV